MKLAIISDVHGNGHALDAVLDDIAKQGADGMFNLGDVVSGPLQPGRVAERMMAEKIVTIRGNHDRSVSAGSDLGAVDQFAAAALSAEQHGWLATLPATLEIYDEILLCHGTPTNDMAPFIDNWWDGRAMNVPDVSEVAKRAGAATQTMIFCGHTHMAKTVRLPDGRQIVNPGSVGLQFLSGIPDARYALAERSRAGWHVSFRVVPYDHDAAAREAVRNGFARWGEALRSGWESPVGLF